MRYIRTKIDTIEILVREDVDGTITTEKYNELGIKITNKMKSSWAKKTADTIEELCDEFVIVDKNGKYLLVVKDKKSLSVIAKNENVYGAVWTDKGLMYVAKMNDKGKLELL